MADDKPADRLRGVGFPVVPLGDAVRIVGEAAKFGAAHTTTAFAQYMGHSTVNSGAFKQRFAAFKDWGLVSAREERVLLTDLAKEIALSDDDARSPLLRSSFMKCDLFRTLYDNTAKGVSIELSALSKQAALKHGVAAMRSQQFAKVFAESAVTAGLASQPEPGKVILLGDGVAQSGTLNQPRTAPTTGSAAPNTNAQNVLKHHAPVAGGAVTLEVSLDRPLPAAAYAHIQRVVESVNELVAVLGGEEISS